MSFNVFVLVMSVGFLSCLKCKLFSLYVAYLLRVLFLYGLFKLVLCVCVCVCASVIFLLLFVKE